MEAKGHLLAADEGDEKEAVMVMARAEIQSNTVVGQLGAGDEVGLQMKDKTTVGWMDDMSKINNK